MRLKPPSPPPGRSRLSPRRRRTLPASLLVFVLFAASVPIAGAFGTREDPIAQADKLIKDQQYDDAIAYLLGFIKKYPDRFDAAQKRIQSIILRREEYTNAAKSLLAFIRENPDADAEILRRLQELERLDKYANKTTVVTLKQTRLTIKNQKTLLTIMTKGRGLLDQGNYLEASRTYLDGFAKLDEASLFWPEFRDAGYDAITVSAVTGLVDKTRAAEKSFEELQAGLEAATAALKTAFATGEPDRAKAALPQAQAAVLDLNRRRLAAYGAGGQLLAWYRTVPKELAGEKKAAIEYNFMSYADLFIRGRPDTLGPDLKPEGEKGRPEGLAGAMLMQLASVLDSSQAAATASLETAYAGGQKAYEAGDMGRAQAEFDRAAKLSGPALETIAMWGGPTSTELYPGTTAFGKDLATTRAAAYERVRHLGVTAAGAARLSALALKARKNEADALAYVGSLPADTALPAALASLRGYRSELVAVGTELDALRSASAASARDLGRWTTAGLAGKDSAEAQGILDGRIAALTEKARSSEVLIVARASALEYNALEADITARAKGIDEGRSYINGVASGDPALAGLVIRQPSLSIRILNEQAAAIAKLRGSIADFLARYRGETLYVAGSSAVQTWIARAGDLDRSAGALQTNDSALIAAATKLKRDADQSKTAAELALGQSRANLAGTRFEQALKSLEDARAKFSDSLSAEYDVVFRKDSDTRIQSLSDEIKRRWNDKVVKDTSDLLDQGQKQYVSGDFTRAETSILAAQEAWKPTHAEPNTLVAYWLRLTRNALSVTTGSDIPQTDERYPEVSQMLNRARTYVDTGNALLAQKNKSDALRNFSLANELINTIVRAFPLNQDARILSLQIDQKSDPERFAQNFQNRLTAAKARLATDQAKAYADLKSLSAIDPRFPGLKGALDEAEYSLGIKTRPPNPADVARARQLVAQAQTIFNRNDPTQFDIVRKLLGDAYALDPGNKDISAVLNRLDTFQGGSGSLVLSDSSQKQYDKAAQLYASGDSLGALAIIQALLKDPKNNVPKVRDLYDRLNR